MNELSRFVDAQRAVYPIALHEIRQGRKASHWMWFIFPQLTALGRSATAKRYGIADLEEATAYLKHPVLGPRLVEISHALLNVHGRTAHAMMGSPDDLKLHSCMTLFSLVSGTDPVFQAVLEQYYDGLPDISTTQLIHAS